MYYPIEPQTLFVSLVNKESSPCFFIVSFLLLSNIKSYVNQELHSPINCSHRFTKITRLGNEWGLWNSLIICNFQWRRNTAQLIASCKLCATRLLCEIRFIGSMCVQSWRGSGQQITRTKNRAIEHCGLKPHCTHLFYIWLKDIGRFWAEKGHD